VVGETNDGRLNDVRARTITPQHAIEAIEQARSADHSPNTLARELRYDPAWRAFASRSSMILPMKDDLRASDARNAGS
jgi:Peptidase family S58